MKICIIGTSHAHSFRMGWHIISENYPDISTTFYDFGGLYFNNFEADVKNRVLKMTHDRIKAHFVKLTDGDGDIDFDEFDACLIVGAFLETPHFRMEKEITPIGILSMLGSKHRESYSMRVQDQAFIDIFAKIHAAGLLRKIRDISDIPVFFPHDSFQTPKEDLPVAEMVNPYSGYNYENGVDLLNKIVLAPINARLLHQPPETIVAPYFTDRKYGMAKRKPSKAEIEAGYEGEFIEGDLRIIRFCVISRIQIRLMGVIGQPKAGIYRFSNGIS